MLITLALVVTVWLLLLLWFALTKRPTRSYPSPLEVAREDRWAA